MPRRSPVRNPQQHSRTARAESLEGRALFAVAAPGEVLTSVTHPTTGHTYHLLERTTWEDAEAKSLALGGHLVAVNDAAEQEFLWSTFGPLTGLFWIGLHDTAHEGQFTWTTGEPATYTNWFPGEPNNLYPAGERWANMWIDYGGAWNDLGPESEQGQLQYAVTEVRNGPDLFVTLGDVPSTSLQPGGSFTLTGTLRNLGSVTVPSDVQLAHYVSTDTTLDDGDRLIGSQTLSSGGLPFNTAISFSTDVVLPADVPPAGTYYLLSAVDSDDAVAEADETNNVSSSRAFDLGAALVPVYRTVRGFVRDGDDLPLHGAVVTVGDQAAYTDYDGIKKKTLDKDGVTGDFELADVLIGYNVTFAGAFGRFVAAAGASDNLTAAASDLGGGSYVTSVSIDEILTLNLTQPDGGLPADTPATLRPIFLADYRTTAADGSIHLHKDLRNDKYSDRISTKPHKALAASGRYRKGVEAVVAKLASLGFLEASGAPLLSVSEIKAKSPAEQALKLFKDIRFGPSSGTDAKPVKSKSTVDEATLSALNDNAPADGLMWTNVLPAKWSVAPGVTDAYVNRSTYDAMRVMAEASTATGFVLTRGSPPLGGTGKTFRTGGEIEFRWIDVAGTSQASGSFWQPVEGVDPRDVTLLGGKRIGVPDPAELDTTWEYVADYDPVQTGEAVQVLLTAGATRVGFNDPTLLEDLGAISISDEGKRTIILTRADLRPGMGYDAVLSASFPFAD